MSQQQQNQTSRKASAQSNSAPSSQEQTGALNTASEYAHQALDTVQKTWAKVPTPTKRTQVIIASGIALGAVGIAAYVMARRRPKLGILGSLMGPAMVAWSAYQKAVEKGRNEIESRLH